jgi:hypothetical protein
MNQFQNPLNLLSMKSIHSTLVMLLLSSLGMILSAQTGTINAEFWLDTSPPGTGQALKDASELPATGVSIELYDNSDNLVSTVPTDASGIATFSNVSPGSHYMKIVLPANHYYSGFKSSRPFDDNKNDFGINDGISTTFTVASGETVDYIDGALRAPGTIETEVWSDLSPSGNNRLIKNAGEPGLSGITVELLDVNNSNAVLASTTTDGNGIAEFENITPSDRPLALKYYLPEDYSFPFRASSNLLNDNISDADPITGITGSFSFNAGSQTIDVVDCGMWAPGVIKTQVFEDANDNVIKDANEDGIYGVQVNLLETNGSPVTYPDGHPNEGDPVSAITQCGSGEVELYFPADRPVKLQYNAYGSTFSKFPSSTFNADNRNDADASGLTIDFEADCGSKEIEYIDAGIASLSAGYAASSINVLVWDERATNGLRNFPTDKPILGVTVNLYDCNGNIATTTTDADGVATFSGIPAGDYQVEVIPPVDYGIHAKTWPVTQPGRHHVDPNTGLTPTFNLANSGSKTLGAALISPGISLARVWEDNNGNGIRNPNNSATSDEWLFGMEAELLEEDGSPVINPNTNQPVKGIIPCGDGGLELYTPADREVKIHYIANGATFTKKLGGNNSSRNSADLVTGETDLFKLTSGNQTYGGAPAGVTDLGTNILDATINTFVWDDRNADGNHQGEGGFGIGGVKVSLTDLNGNECICAYTDAQGNATLGASANGDFYRLDYTLKEDHQFTISPGTLTDDKNNDAKLNSSQGRSTSKFKVLSGQTISYIKAGMFAPGTLNTFVWDDRNNNGDHQGEGGFGIEGVTVQMVELDGTTPVKYPKWHPNKNQVVTALPTGTNGQTSFDYLPADRFVRLLYTLKDDHKFSFGSGAVTVTNNSDIYTQSSGVAETRKFKMVKGSETISYVECGMLAPGNLSTFVYDDRNADGTHQGEGAFGIEGVDVQLVELDGSTPVVYPDWWTGPGNAGDPVATVTTGPNGKADIDYVPADRFVRLTYTLKDDHQFVFGSGAVTITNNSDIYNASGGVAESRKFSLAGGSESISYVEAGMLVPGTLNTFVFDDRNADGTHQGEGAYGIEGVDIQLVELDGSTPVEYPDWHPSAGTPVTAATTNSSGLASIDYIPADRFVRLVYTLKDDHRFTTSSGAVENDKNSDVYNNNGETRKFKINKGSEMINYVECGMWAPGTIETFVWEDVNGNGDHNGEGSLGIGGATVNLLNLDDTPVIDPSNASVSATTGSDGYATLSYVPADRDLRLQYILPNGYSFTQKLNNSPNDATMDNDADNDGKTRRFSLKKGSEMITYIKAGAVSNSSLAETGTSADRLNNPWNTGGQLSLSSDLHLFPVPTSSTLNIALQSTQEADAQYRVLDALGRIVAENNFVLFQGDNRLQIAVDQLPAGNYVLQVVTQDKMAAKPFIIARQ